MSVRCSLLVAAVSLKHLICGVALFVVLGIISPSLAGGEGAPAPASSQTTTPVVQAIAPPAAQQVPPGSASTSPNERRSMEAIRMAPEESITLDGRLDEDVWMRAVPATKTRATTARHTNVLMHALGHLKARLEKQSRDELLSVIEDYRRRLVPRIVPLTLIRHHARTLDIAYLLGQQYLNPHPKELALLNHV